MGVWGRQHTVKIEKALFDLGYAPSEAMCLLRLLYRALAECESMMIGLPEVGEALRKDLVNTIHSRVDEVTAIL